MKNILVLILILASLIFSKTPPDSLLISAQEGDLSAQEELGKFYFNEAQESSSLQEKYHHPDSKDRFNEELDTYKYEALKWLHIAADNGSKKAFYYLGNYYNSCCWGEDNADSAFYYWNKGSKLGEKYSLKQLAYLYLNGIGCEKDVMKAHVLSWKAFFKGNMSTPLIWISKLLDIEKYVS